RGAALTYRGHTPKGFASYFECPHRQGSPAGQQAADLVVTDLGEVGVPLPDRPEPAGHFDGDDLVAQVGGFGIGRTHGNGQHDGGRAVLPHVPQGGAGTHAGGQAVVDDDDVTAAHVGFGGAPAVDLHAAAGLALFDGDRVGQPVLGEA